MSILKGEQSKVLTIFGTVTVPSPAQSRSAYLARPDQEGEWPTILVMAGQPGISSPVKEVCRRLARQGFAVLAPESVFSFPDLERYESYITNPTAEWSNAEYGYGLLALPAGRDDAVVVAAAEREIAALAVLGVPSDHEALSLVPIPTLALAGGADAGSVDVAREAAPGVGWVVYGDADEGWWDDASEGWDEVVATDALGRLSAFFSEHLPPVL